MSAYAGTAELARVLRLRAPTAEQAAAMDRVLEAAATEIDDELGVSYAGTAGTAGTPALVVEVNLERAVEHWQQQESPFGVIGLGDAVPTMTARDSWERHANKLAGLKETWGIG